MKNQPKSLSTKKPPIPSKDYIIIEDWMANRIMPSLNPMIKKIDTLIHNSIPNLHYAIKWGNAYYGTEELGWLIEVAAYDVSANIVFLNGAAFDPRPLLGTGIETRYIKITSIDSLNEKSLIVFMKQAMSMAGWK